MNREEFVPVPENALFSGLTAERLADLYIRLQPAAFEPGAIIFDEDEAGDCCYLLERGLVRISKNAGGGVQETLGFIFPGEFFGELALYCSAPRAARATVVSPCTTHCLPRAEFERLRRDAPYELASAIAAVGIRHLRELHTNLVRHLSDADRFRDIGLGLGMIAHDIRSPLATIASAGDLLTELIQLPEPDPAQLTRFAQIIQRTAQNTLASADELLAFIRGEAGPVMESVQLPALIDEIAENVAGLLPSDNTQFDIVCSSDGSIAGERKLLVRAFVNLLRNAAEALPKEGGRVELHVTENAGSVVFTVSDTGCGIPYEVQARIFERRFTHGKQGGTGLGLDQVRRAVELHRGTIQVDSTPGAGTTFVICMPAGGAAPMVSEPGNSVLNS